VVEGSGDMESRRVDPTTGAVSPTPPEVEAATAVAPVDPPFAVAAAQVQIRGATALWSAKKGTFAFLLDRHAAPVEGPGAGCDTRLSPRGLWALRLCAKLDHPGAGGGKIVSLLGEPARDVAPLPDVRTFAVADDGSAVFAAGQLLRVLIDGVARDIDLVRGR